MPGGQQLGMKCLLCVGIVSGTGHSGADKTKSVFPRTHTLENCDPTRRGKGRRNDDNQVFGWEEAEGVGGTNLPK